MWPVNGDVEGRINIMPFQEEEEEEEKGGGEELMLGVSESGSRPESLGHWRRFPDESLGGRELNSSNYLKWGDNLLS